MFDWVQVKGEGLTTIQSNLIKVVVLAQYWEVGYGDVSQYTEAISLL